MWGGGAEVLGGGGSRGGVLGLEALLGRVVVVMVGGEEVRVAAALQAAVGDKVPFLLLCVPVVERVSLLLSVVVVLLLLLGRGARRVAVVAQEHGLGALREARGVHDGGESAGSSGCHAGRRRSSRWRNHSRTAVIVHWVVWKDRPGSRLQAQRAGAPSHAWVRCG